MLGDIKVLVVMPSSLIGVPVPVLALSSALRRFLLHAEEDSCFYDNEIIERLDFASSAFKGFDDLVPVSLEGESCMETEAMNKEYFENSTFHKETLTSLLRPPM